MVFRRKKMTTETYNVKKIEDNLASLGAYFDQKAAAAKATIKNIETHLAQLGNYFDSNPLALIESSYVQLKKRKVSLAEVDGLRKKLQVAYKQAKVMPINQIVQFYHQRGLEVNTATYRQNLYEKCVEMAQELADLKANSAESSLAKLLGEYDPLTWDTETPIVVSKAPVAPKAPAVKRKITAELKENLERKVASTLSPKSAQNQTRAAAFSMYADKYGVKDGAIEPVLARSHAKKKGFWGKMAATLTTCFLASTIGTVIGYNLPACEQTKLPVDYSPAISVEYHGVPAAGVGKINKKVSKTVNQNTVSKPVQIASKKVSADCGNKRLIEKFVTNSPNVGNSFPVTIESGDTIYYALCGQDRACVSKTHQLNPGKDLSKIFPGDVVRFPQN